MFWTKSSSRKRETESTERSQTFIANVSSLGGARDRLRLRPGRWWRAEGTSKIFTSKERTKLRQTLQFHPRPRRSETLESDLVNSVKNKLKREDTMLDRTFEMPSSRTTKSSHFLAFKSGSTVGAGRNKRKCCCFQLFGKENLRVRPDLLDNR